MIANQFPRQTRNTLDQRAFAKWLDQPRVQDLARDDPSFKKQALAARTEDQRDAFEQRLTQHSGNKTFRCVCRCGCGKDFRVAS